jgi:hypothetical protein
VANVALGFKVRTGKAAVVALRGSAMAPEVAGKAMIQVAFAFEEGAVFHSAQHMPTANARTHVENAEARFTKLAHEKLTDFVTKLGANIVATRLAAPAERPLPALERIVRSHPLVHAAEIELYRRVFAAACKAIGVPSERVDEAAKKIALALRWKPGQVANHLQAMGKRSGRPWAAEQKEAALAAWLALAQR